MRNEPVSAACSAGPDFHGWYPERQTGYVLCCGCGSAGRADEMEEENYGNLGPEPRKPEWTYLCRVCQEDTKQKVQEMMPKIREKIDNAMNRENIKFDL